VAKLIEVDEEEYLSSKIKSLAELTAIQATASKEAVAAALNSVKEQSSAALLAAEKAIDKSEDAVQRRFESVNEFRETLSDQAKNFINREEWNANTKRLEERISTLQSRMDTREGTTQGISSSWGFVVGAIGVVSGLMIGGAAVVTLIMKVVSQH